MSHDADIDTDSDREKADSDREKALVDLVKLDYDVALRAVSGFVSTSAQLRAVGIGGWGVVLGLALRDRSAALAGLAFVLTLIFCYADAFHAALYRRALARAIRLEGLLDAYLDRLGIDAEDEDAILEVLAKLETHRFGMYRALRQPRWQEYFRSRPKAVFWVIYPALLLASLVACAWFA